MLTLDKIYHASFVLKDVIRRTELVPAPNVNKKATVFLKPENLQLTGSFKVRGSYYKISQLSEEEKISKSHYVIYTNDNCSELEQLLKTLEKIL